MADPVATGVVAQFVALRGAQFLRLTTFRKSGVGVPTQVWFAQEGDTLFITTTATAGKVKRIRNNPRALVAPCDARGNSNGPEVEAQARILTPAEFAQANAALKAKYGFRYTFVRFAGQLARRGRVERVYLAVTPAT